MTQTLAQICPTPPRAPHFIVTLYGDVVEPRGGALWMGSLIEVCAQHGISESLVRTAVSRLVASGRLEGVRVGRRSFYQLSEQAKQEFQNASRILFDPEPLPTRWQIALLGPEAPDLRRPWVRVGNGAALAPLTSDPSLPGAVVFQADQPFGDLPELARRHWPLDDVAAAYRVFLDRFSGLETHEAKDALALRLRLVDDYRSAALADPRLPKGALPDNWPADEARRLFVRLYLAMSESASRQIPALCESQDGPLPPQTAASTQREARLMAEARSL